MIKGFEQQTCELSDYEINTLLKPIKRGLETKIGKSKSITNAEIINAMKFHGYKISSVRLRKIINYIRVNDIVPLLIANGKDGYYIATEKKEVLDYIESLKQREKAISDMRLAIEKQFKIINE